MSPRRRAAACLIVIASLAVVAGTSWLWLHRGNAMLLDLSFTGCL